MKHVVSVSLGTSQRDKVVELDLLGERFRIERRGTDGDTARFAALFGELDGQVDALGVGGADLSVRAGARVYRFRQIQRLVRQAARTPVVDGSGLKHTLERAAVGKLQSSEVVDFREETTLLVSAVDRFGLAQALVELKAPCLYGDLAFGLGLPVALRRYESVERLGRLILPVLTLLPQQWIYPVGKKQETRTPRHEWIFREATWIAGDWHFIRRYAPDRLEGKSILTQTVRKADLEWLRQAGTRRVVTTTPFMEGETFATNVLEAVVVAYLARPLHEIGESDYQEVLRELNWSPQVTELNEC